MLHFFSSLGFFPKNLNLFENFRMDTGQPPFCPHLFVSSVKDSFSSGFVSILLFSNFLVVASRKRSFWHSRKSSFLFQHKNRHQKNSYIVLPHILFLIVAPYLISTVKQVDFKHQEHAKFAAWCVQLTN